MLKLKGFEIDLKTRDVYYVLEDIDAYPPKIEKKLSNTFIKYRNGNYEFNTKPFSDKGYALSFVPLEVAGILMETGRDGEDLEHLIDVAKESNAEFVGILKGAGRDYQVIIPSIDSLEFNLANKELFTKTEEKKDLKVYETPDLVTTTLFKMQNAIFLENYVIPLVARELVRFTHRSVVQKIGSDSLSLSFQKYIKWIVENDKKVDVNDFINALKKKVEDLDADATHLNASAISFVINILKENKDNIVNLRNILLSAEIPEIRRIGDRIKELKLNVIDFQAGSTDAMFSALDKTGYTDTYVLGTEIRQLNPQNDRNKVMYGVSFLDVEGLLQHNFDKVAHGTPMWKLGIFYLNPPYTNAGMIERKSVELVPDGAVFYGLFPTKSEKLLRNNIEGYVVEIPAEFTGYTDPQTPEKFLLVFGIKNSINPKSYKISIEKSEVDEINPDTLSRKIIDKLREIDSEAKVFSSLTKRFFGANGIASYLKNYRDNAANNFITAVRYSVNQVKERRKIEEFVNSDENKKKFIQKFSLIESAKNGAKIFPNLFVFSKNGKYPTYSFDEIKNNSSFWRLYKENYPSLYELMLEVAKSKNFTPPVTEQEKLISTNKHLGLMYYSLVPESVELTDEVIDVIIDFYEGFYREGLIEQSDLEDLKVLLEKSQRVVVKSVPVLNSEGEVSLGMTSSLVLVDRFGNDIASLGIPLSEFYKKLEKKDYISTEDKVEYLDPDNEFKEILMKEFSSYIKETLNNIGFSNEDFKSFLSELKNVSDAQKSGVVVKLTDVLRKYSLKLQEKISEVYKIRPIPEYISQSLGLFSRTTYKLDSPLVNAIIVNVMDEYLKDPYYYGFNPDELDLLIHDTLDKVLEKDSDLRDPKYYIALHNAVKSGLDKHFTFLNMASRGAFNLLISLVDIVKMDAFLKQKNIDKAYEIFKTLMIGKYGIFPHQFNEGINLAYKEFKYGDVGHILGWEMRSGKTMAMILGGFFSSLITKKDTYMFVKTANMNDIISQIVRFLPPALFNVIAYPSGDLKPDTINTKNALIDDIYVNILKDSTFRKLLIGSKELIVELSESYSNEMEEIIEIVEKNLSSNPNYFSEIENEFSDNMLFYLLNDTILDEKTKLSYFFYLKRLADKDLIDTSNEKLLRQFISGLAQKHTMYIDKEINNEVKTGGFSIHLATKYTLSSIPVKMEVDKKDINIDFAKNLSVSSNRDIDTVKRKIEAFGKDGFIIEGKSYLQFLKDYYYENLDIDDNAVIKSIDTDFTTDSHYVFANFRGAFQEMYSNFSDEEKAQFIQELAKFLPDDEADEILSEDPDSILYDMAHSYYSYYKRIFFEAVIESVKSFVVENEYHFNGRYFYKVEYPKELADNSEVSKFLSKYFDVKVSDLIDEFIKENSLKGYVSTILSKLSMHPFFDYQAFKSQSGYSLFLDRSATTDSYEVYSFKDLKFKNGTSFLLFNPKESNKGKYVFEEINIGLLRVDDKIPSFEKFDKDIENTLNISLSFKKGKNGSVSSKSKPEIKFDIDVKDERVPNPTATKGNNVSSYFLNTKHLNFNRNVIVDEADENKDPFGLYYLTTKTFTMPSSFRVMATGTPANGYPESLFSLIGLASKKNIESIQVDVNQAMKDFSILSVKDNQPIVKLILYGISYFGEGFASELGRLILAAEKDEVDVKTFFDLLKSFYYGAESEYSELHNLVSKLEVEGNVSYLNYSLNRILLALNRNIKNKFPAFDFNKTSVDILVSSMYEVAKASREGGTFNPLGLVKSMPKDVTFSFQTRDNIKKISAEILGLEPVDETVNYLDLKFAKELLKEYKETGEIRQFEESPIADVRLREFADKHVPSVIAKQMLSQLRDLILKNLSNYIKEISSDPSEFINYHGLNLKTGDLKRLLGSSGTSTSDSVFDILKYRLDYADEYPIPSGETKEIILEKIKIANLIEEDFREIFENEGYSKILESYEKYKAKVSKSDGSENLLDDFKVQIGAYKVPFNIVPLTNMKGDKITLASIDKGMRPLISTYSKDGDKISTTVYFSTDIDFFRSVWSIILKNPEPIKYRYKYLTEDEVELIDAFTNKGYLDYMQKFINEGVSFLVTSERQLVQIFAVYDFLSMLKIYQENLPEEKRPSYNIIIRVPGSNIGQLLLENINVEELSKLNIHIKKVKDNNTLDFENKNLNRLQKELGKDKVKVAVFSTVGTVARGVDLSNLDIHLNIGAVKNGSDMSQAMARTVNLKDKHQINLLMFGTPVRFVSNGDRLIPSYALLGTMKTISKVEFIKSVMSGNVVNVEQDQKIVISEKAKKIVERYRQNNENLRNRMTA